MAENNTQEGPPEDTGEAADDGVVTSATSSVGSLLSDLLSEAQREVEKEREDLQSMVAERDAEARDSQIQEEARKREENTRRVIEETRRRNESFARKERAEQGLDRPASSSVTTEDLGGRAPQALPAKSSKGLIAALVLVLAGALVLGFLFMDSSGKLTEATKTVGSQDSQIKSLTSREAKLRTEIATVQLENRRHSKALAKLKTQLAKVEALAVERAKRIKQVEAERDAAKKALAAAPKGVPTKVATGKRRGKSKRKSGLKLKSNLFKKKRKR